MRPAIVSWNPFEMAAIWSGLVPIPLVQVFWGMGLSRSVIAGIRLGLFDALSDGPHDAEKIAVLTGCSTQAIEPLLAALNGFGFLKRSRGRYGLTRESRKWLLEDSKTSIREVLLFLGDLFASIEPMEETLKGEVANFHHRGLDEGVWENYMRGLGVFATYQAAEIVRKIPVPGNPVRLLDVGGGHGLYSVALCNRYPGLEADIIDLPQAAVIGEAMVAEKGMKERIHYRHCDLRTCDWGSGYDMVLMFNILHNLREEECAEACRKGVEALRKGGTLVVCDAESRTTDGNYSVNGGFGALFFFLVSGARAWPETAIRNWLLDAGLGKIVRRRSLRLPGMILLTGNRA